MGNWKTDKMHIDNLVGLADVMSRMIKEMTKDDIKFCDGCVNCDNKSIHVYEGIEYLGYILGADTWEETMHSYDRSLKCFKYNGWKFFELNDTAPDGTVYYR